MAADIAPELLEAIQETFREEIQRSPIIKRYAARIAKNGTMVDVNRYAYEVGRTLSNAFLVNLSTADLPNGRIYYNIANRIIPPMMQEEFGLCTDAANTVITRLNKGVRLNMQGMAPDINMDRINGIVDAVSSQEELGAALEYLQAPVENFAVHTVDDTVRHNAKIQYDAGLQPKIVRTSNGKCCPWCESLVGEYDYPVSNPEVYQRHENCNCVVEYRPTRMRAQNVWSKDWRSTE